MWHIFAHTIAHTHPHTHAHMCCYLPYVVANLNNLCFFCLFCMHALSPTLSVSLFISLFLRINFWRLCVPPHPFEPLTHILMHIQYTQTKGHRRHSWPGGSARRAGHTRRCWAAGEAGTERRSRRQRRTGCTWSGRTLSAGRRRAAVAGLRLAAAKG